MGQTANGRCVPIESSGKEKIEKALFTLAAPQGGCFAGRSTVSQPHGGSFQFTELLHIPALLAISSGVNDATTLAAPGWLLRRTH